MFYDAAMYTVNHHSSHSISENTAHIEICNNTAAINFNETGCYDHLNLHFYDRKDRHNWFLSVLDIQFYPKTQGIDLFLLY